MLLQLILKYTDNTNASDMVTTPKQQYYTIKNDEKTLVEFINKELEPKEKEKREHGEVFTPLRLIHEMLDKLDTHYMQENDKSIFSEKSFTWFDPACGIGNFPVALYHRLMRGLKSQIQNEEIRRKHIVEKMIYMSEYNSKNIFLCKKIFCSDIYNLNIHQGNTLSLDTLEKWNIPTFDVILGNPPYNKGNIKSKKEKNGKKATTIWPDFILYSMKLLKTKGYLVFINPLGWLRESYSVHDTLLENHIVWLKLWDNAQSKQNIKGRIPISLFVLYNEKNTEKRKTEIESELKNANIYSKSFEYLDKRYSIPLAYHNIFKKLGDFIEKHDLQLIYETKKIPGSKRKSIIPIPDTYSIDDNYAVYTYTMKEGLKVKKLKVRHRDADKPKLIIANKSGFNGAFIDNGELGITGGEKVYILGTHLDQLKRMFTFKITYLIANLTKYRMDILDTVAYKYIPDIRKLNLPNLSESDLYKLIGFSKTEIDIIERYGRHYKTFSSIKKTVKKHIYKRAHKQTQKRLSCQNQRQYSFQNK